MARGYNCLMEAKYNEKYLIRLQNKDLKKQIDKMKSNDEIIIIHYQYN